MKKLLFLFLLTVTASSQFSLTYAEEMRAIFDLWNGDMNNLSSVGSDDAYQLYRRMGYNTLIQIVPLSGDPGNWNLDANGVLTMDPAYRTDLVDSIRHQRDRARAAGLNYCPFYNGWGYGGPSSTINTRSKASIYREVDSIVTINYYGSNIYDGLTKQLTSWATNATVSFNGGVPSIEYEGGPSEGAAKICMQTNSSVISTTELIDNQCYNFRATVDLAGSNYQVGDEFHIYYFRAFAPGEQPDSTIIPLGKEFTSADRKFVYAKRLYTITNVTGGVFEINGNPAGTVIEINDTLWIDTKYTNGLFDYNYDDSFEWHLMHKKIEHAARPGSSIQINNFQIIPLDPSTQLAYTEWESNLNYSNFLSRYPDERHMTTRAVYLNTNNGGTYEIDRFQGTITPGSRLLRIKGHFRPRTTPMGWNYDDMNSLDPLSPVTRSINSEVLDAIREALDDIPPDYYFIQSDEVPIFRRDRLSKQDGTERTPYSKLSNGQFYEEIIKMRVEEFRVAFPGAETKFLTYPDMFLPIQASYNWFAEKYGDEDALACFQKDASNFTIIITPWVYDYGRSGLDKNKFGLADPIFIRSNLSKLRKYNLKFCPVYATDGRLQELQAINNSITNDAEHIDHEIQMARKWCDYVSEFKDNCVGYVYCGWTDSLRENAYNGLFPLAYFGWWRPQQRSLPHGWDAISGTPDQHGQPVLDLLERRQWVLVPGVPTDVKAIGKSRSRIDLSWTKNGRNDDLVSIERAPAGGSFTEIARLTGEDESYQDNGLTPGISYQYRIRSSTDGNSWSAFSNTVTASTYGNLALNKPASGSTEESSRSNYYKKGNDGWESTRWCASSEHMPEWWMVDLGALKSVAEFEIKFENQGIIGDCYDFIIETSLDKSTWTRRVNQNPNTNTAQTQSFTLSTPVIARYVRITINDAPRRTWASFFEFRVFGFCSISYNTTGGNEVSGQSVLDGGKAYNPVPPTKIGYSFGGWYKDMACTKPWNFATDVASGNTTLYAKWLILDADNNQYHDVKIGNQVWMVENLKTTKFNDGTDIPYRFTNEWNGLTTPAYRWLNDDQGSYNSYGGLYNSFAVRTGNLAPDGWHVPTDADWDELSNYLWASGGLPAKALASETGWSPYTTITGAIGNNLSENNRTGFYALPGGFVNSNGDFNHAETKEGFWWSSNSPGISLSYSSSIINETSSLLSNNTCNNFGFSVRLLRDAKEGFDPFLDATKWYRIAPVKDNTRYLDVVGQQYKNGTPIGVWTRSNRNQEFQFKDAGNGYVTITVRGDPRYSIEILSFSKDSQMKLMETDVNNPKQKFKLVLLPNGFYRIETSDPGFSILGVTNIYQRPYLSTSNDINLYQQWEITPVK